ncbi:hypothetical protein O3M35_009806 [Rhynocoris fuscipes]|uniref:Uncharacterized protein n=1 Tax=Rhynocoris fuscipes TaxID=488301 RepID=A0AAW1D9L1_9HEMI
MGLVEDFHCHYGERETAEHIILDCTLYEDSRAAMQRKVGFHLAMDVETLPILIENKVAYEAFRECAAKTLRRRLNSGNRG